MSRFFRIRVGQQSELSSFLFGMLINDILKNKNLLGIEPVSYKDSGDGDGDAEISSRSDETI